MKTVIGIAALGGILLCFAVLSLLAAKPYTLVIVAPLAPIVSIEFDSEAKCIEAGHAIRDTYTAAGRGGQLNCYAK